MDTVNWSNNYFAITGKPKFLALHQKRSGAVAIATDSDNFLLIKIKRADNQYHYEFPRGFKLPHETGMQCAKRELFEETALHCDSVLDAGSMMPDSGLMDSNIDLEICLVDFYKQAIYLQTSEKIVDYKIVSNNDLAKMIKLNQITDSFTISGYLKTQLILN